MDDFEDNEVFIEDNFDRAIRYVPTVLYKLSTESKLTFYGLYKQATVGDCNIPKPGFLSFEAKSKWNSWKSFEKVNKVDAMKRYCDLLDNLEPSWSKNGIKGAVFVSRPVFEEQIKGECDKTIFDFVKDNDIITAKKLLADQPDLIKTTDDEGMSLLHWAADRGHTDIVQLLLSSGADIDLLDNLNQSPLLYGAAANNFESVRVLLKYNPDVNLQDEDGLTAMQLTSDQRIKELLLNQ